MSLDAGSSLRHSGKNDGATRIGGELLAAGSKAMIMIPLVARLRKEWTDKIEIFAAYVLLLVIYWCIDLMQ